MNVMAADSTPSAERPHADADNAYVERALRTAQGTLARSRIMRSDAGGVFEITLRGDFYPSRIKLKQTFGLEPGTVSTLEEALFEALREVVAAGYEEQRKAFLPLLPTGGSGTLPEPLPNLASREAKAGTAPLALAALEKSDAARPTRGRHGHTRSDPGTRTERKQSSTQKKESAT